MDIDKESSEGAAYKSKLWASIIIQGILEYSVLESSIQLIDSIPISQSGSMMFIDEVEIQTKYGSIWLKDQVAN